MWEGLVVDWFKGVSWDKPEEQAPVTYASAADAVSAILHNSLRDSYFRDMQVSLNCQAAATAIMEGAHTLSFDSVGFRSLEVASQKMTDSKARKDIRNVLLSWAEANWSTVVTGLREEALKLFTEHYYSSSHDSFSYFVDRWQRLKNDSQLLYSLIEAMEQGHTVLDTSVPRLRTLNGHQAAAERVLTVVMAPRASFHEQDELASLIAEWASDSAWGQLQHLLWRVGAKSDRKQTALDLSTQKVTKVADLLHEFGILSFNVSNYRLSELSAETRASWRRELKAVIGNDDALREATTEALLWFGSPHDDRAVLFAVLELHDDCLERSLAPLLAHPDGLVRRRAAAAIGMIRLEPDAMALVQSRRTTSRPSSSRTARSLERARTWIGDARIEQLIENTLDEAAGHAGSAIDKALHSGEESHVMLLFERLSAAFSSITDQLAALAAETNANERLNLKLKHRIVGKHEEGGIGIGTERFSADVCLLFEAHDSGKCFARRASLLQAKRLHRPKGIDHYPIKKSQLEDLTGQTLASFLLLLGPECEGVRIPVIPAHLILDLIERGEPSTQIAPANASRLGKGIGAWLVEDIIGLWTGDWDYDIVERAEGGKDREPFVLAEVVVERVRKGPDGWLV